MNIGDTDISPEEADRRYQEFTGKYGASLKSEVEIPKKLGDPRFYTILGEMALTHAKKSQDYGTDQDALTNLRSSEDFGVPAWVGTAIRMNDKMKRIQAMATKGSLANESVEDSLLDISCYAILTLILFRETQEKKST